ncbi:hypothetical protein MKY34_15560 [Sporosarcina sp. FSL K6-1522]|uniref:hypothetical protein n=1 Tax=Sporosarcina sp. FSL K6-1522 TaxID=2921554 RepID=UPI00315A461E
MNLLLVVGIIALFVLLLIFARRQRNYQYSKKLVAPPWADQETQQLFQQFNQAWSTTIETTVNERIQQAGHTLANSELRERWYELKKFLLLAGVSKGLPMFSTQVDDLWHFFLDEKELYQDFCVAFIGERIEHYPHETPKNLPTERAWFDLLYVSFFNVTSHSHLWGEFMQNRQEHRRWTEQIANHPKDVIESFGRQTSNATSVYTLAAFLAFATEQMTAGSQVKRVNQIDGYWYGAAVFSLHGSDPIQEQKKKHHSTSSADGSGGYADSPEQKEQWDEIVAEVNTFEAGSNTGSGTGSTSTTSSHTHSNDGGSDSGSSCSSCSGCSS